MLKKTISVFILVAIITAAIICGSLTVCAEETQEGDCVVKYVDLDGNIVATQNYAFGEQITGLEAFDSYTQTVILPTIQSEIETAYYNELTDFDFNEIISKLDNDFEKSSSNLLCIYTKADNVVLYKINEQGDIRDFTIIYSENNIEKSVSFEDMSFDNSIYYYGESLYDSPFTVELHDKYCLNFFSLGINNAKNIELLSLSINDELRYKNGVAYKEISKEDLPQIYFPSMTFIVPYKAAPVPTPGDGDNKGETNIDIADETTNFLEKAKSDWNNMWKEIKAFFDKVGNWFRDAWQKISDFFNNLSDLNKNEDIDNDKSDAANNAALLRYSS